MENNKYQDYAKRIVNALLAKDIASILIEFSKPHGDEMTNEVRSVIESSLTSDDIEDVKKFLEELLNYCYDGKLLSPSIINNCHELKHINTKNLFFIKENIIYYLGRLSILPNSKILKKAYDHETNKHVRLNLVFSSLPTFNENIELDFVKQIKPGNDYDIMLRSWTMAFFSNVSDPYSYLDNKNDDWTNAKIPRIKRLNINDSKDSKFLKAMSFRLMDLLVIWLFLENRGVSNLTTTEKEIITNANVEYPSFSLKKQSMMNDLKVKILKK